MNIVAIDLINGLPAHPLLVHAPIVLVPLTCLLFILLIFVPKLRQQYLKVLIGLAVVSLITTFAAKQSGEALSARVGLPIEHSELGEKLVIATATLLAIILLWSGFMKKKNNLFKVFGLVGALVAAVTIYVTVQTGHSGAEATWEDRISEEVSRSAEPMTSPTSESEASGITLDEVATHNSPDDCWTAVDGKVYDLTEFVSQHPGGSDRIENICGVDGTSAFKGQHRGEDVPESTLSNYLIGELAK